MGFLPQPSERQAHKCAPTTAILNVGISAQVFLVDTIIVRACSWICIHTRKYLDVFRRQFLVSPKQSQASPKWSHGKGNAGTYSFLGKSKTETSLRVT